MNGESYRKLNFFACYSLKKLRFAENSVFYISRRIYCRKIMMLYSAQKFSAVDLIGCYKQKFVYRTLIKIVIGEKQKDEYCSNEIWWNKRS